jgi:hypothetical protein
MSTNIKKAIGLTIVLFMIIFLVSCTSQELSQNPIEEKPVITNEQISNPASNQEIMEKYIRDFLISGYSKYYTINIITFEGWNEKTDNGKLEAIVLTTMNSSASGKSNDSNFMFKLTADFINNKIDEKSISLYLEQDSENNKVIYIPAEDILPK